MIKELLIITLLLFSACSNEIKYDLNGKKLIEEKCASCHNLDLPPKTFKDEVAPPMMAISFHIAGFMQTPDESMRIPKAIEFVKDYVIYPNASKSFCDKKSLEDYGVMPSQKGKVTEDELDAIAKYMFKHFTQENLNRAQKLINDFNKMPKGEQLARKNNCLNCHKVDNDTVGPSLKKIALKYKNNQAVVSHSIIHGSRDVWKSSKGAVMPSFRKLSKEDIKTLSGWILSFDSDYR